jgi:hypothetical protein
MAPLAGRLGSLALKDVLMVHAVACPVKGPNWRDLKRGKASLWATFERANAGGNTSLHLFGLSYVGVGAELFEKPTSVTGFVERDCCGFGAASVEAPDHW